MAKIVNFSGFIKDFKASVNSMLGEIDLAMGQSFENVVNEAKSKAPTDHKGGDIGSTISLTRTSKLKYRIKVGNKYAAYYEFGTGPHAKAYVPSLPDEWQKIAEQYKTPIPGNLRKNVYLYDAYDAELQKLIDKMVKIVQNA